jgi:hypothetical protein
LVAPLLATPSLRFWDFDSITEDPSDRDDTAV